MTLRPRTHRLSRRSAMGGLAAAAAGFSHLVAPRHVAASDLSLSDRIDLLYSTQFHFNRDGEPQITVGVMQGQQRVRISAPSGLMILPSGDGGTQITVGRSVEVTLGRARPAQQRYSVLLEELRTGGSRVLDVAAQRWKKAGLDVSEQEIGTLFGVSGTVLDTRRVALTTGAWGSEAEASKHARALATAHGALGRLHPLVGKRASGRMVAKQPGGGAEVAADGVLWFAPRKPGESVTVHDVLSGTTMGTPKRSDRKYRGTIYVAIDRGGELAVVNLISETHVLAGLVPAEIYASAPYAALRAQAVAARGQLVAKLGTRHLDDPFLLCSEQHCQVYAGQDREHPRTTRAVRETAGVVAMRPGGTQLVDTVYSANSGGHTEDNEQVWPSDADPQLRGRADPLLRQPYRDGIATAELGAWLGDPVASYSRPKSEAGKGAYRWTTAIDPGSLEGAPGVPDGIGTLRGLEVLSRGRSGRATAARLVGARKSVVLHGELKIRRALGGLKSSMFVVAPDKDRYGRFVLYGGGHGHGVGMCQHGAIGMATAGKDYSEILAHYYSGALIKKLW